MRLEAMRRVRSLSISLKVDGREWKSFSYPYGRIKIRSDKVMEFEIPYEVKKIVFKITKDSSAYLSTLPSRLTGNGDTFKHVTACYLYLGRERE